MNKVEKKRQREQHVVEDDPTVLPEKSFQRRTSGQKDVPCLSRTFRLRKAKKPEMSIYGAEDILCKL